MFKMLLYYLTYNYVRKLVGYGNDQNYTDISIEMVNNNRGRGHPCCTPFPTVEIKHAAILFYHANWQKGVYFLNILLIWKPISQINLIFYRNIDTYWKTFLIEIPNIGMNLKGFDMTFLKIL